MTGGKHTRYGPDVHKLYCGDLAYWLDDERRPVRCKVELVTNEHVYLRATTTEHGKTKGQVWREARMTRRVAPRPAVYIHQGRGHFDWRQVVIAVSQPSYV